MKISLKETEFTSSWEGDGMRGGDNVRSHTWTGQFVTIGTDGEESEFLLEAITEFGCCRSIDTTVELCYALLKRREAHLKWASEWSRFFNIDQGGWKVATDYSSKDQPEVYDSYGNFVCFVPREVTPGDFNALKSVVIEAFEDEE